MQKESPTLRNSKSFRATHDYTAHYTTGDLSFFIFILHLYVHFWDVGGGAIICTE